MFRKVMVLLLGMAASASAQQPERLWYYVDREDSYESLVKHIKQIDVLAPSAYFVDNQGIVWGDVDPRVRELTARNNVQLMPLLVNAGFDQAALHQLLSTPAARQRAVASLVDVARRHNYWGIQIDFENVNVDDKDNMTLFYREAAQALHAIGKKISIAVVHRPDEQAGPSRYHKWLFANWRAGYDLKALADAGDFISVMTYSQHTRRTPPGPNASLPWTEEVVKHFLQFMPANKLSLGIPTGAMHWYTSQEDRITPEMARSYSATMNYTWAMSLIERNKAKLNWDDEQKAAYAYYPNGGTWEWIFVEDARTFRAKRDLIAKYKLRGFSVWVLGPEDPAVWN
ncbi:MAG TPA: glycosyl hydrolase family 18 protein [Longimicrobiales bacterium]|nr:glycosyl hydrolase family 18 protein [Longimicrobiales bacterium]